MASTEKSSKIPLINGLRGIAILGVVFHHLFGEIFVQGGFFVQFGPLPVPPLTILSNSYQGVALFFMLSGFVLALPYLEGKRTMTSRSDVLNFYRRRAVRLLPLYYVALLIGFIFIAPPENFLSFIKQLFLYSTGTFTFTEKYFFPELNFVLWSLSLELLFSLCFPLVLFFIHKYGIVRTTVSFCIAAMIARYVGFFLIAHHIAQLFTGTTIPIFNTIFCRIDDFVLGMALASLYIRKPIIQAHWWYAVGISSVLFGFAIRDWTAAALPLIVQPVSNTFVNVGFFLLIGTMLLQPERLWKVLLENRPLQLIGMMCFSIFVWHGIAINLLDAHADLWHFTGYIVGVFAFSFITYRYIEFGYVKKLRDVLPQKSM